MRTWNRCIAGALALTLMAGIHSAMAQQQYPTKPVRMIVPYSAGGVVDILGRLVADELTKLLGQPVLVENRTGAGGVLGLESVFNSPHDGYALVMMPANVSILSALYPNLNFDPIRDFTPVVMIGSIPSGLSASTSQPFKTFKELVDYAKANPGKLSYASCGIASPQHLAAELLKSRAKIDIVHITYRGCAEALPDVLSGRVALFFSSIHHALSGQESGKIRMLAVTSRTRTEWAPEVPTIVESGYPDVASDAWFGVLAPRNTPKPIVTRINAEVNKILADPAVQAKLKKAYISSVGGTPESFGALISEDAKQLVPIIKQADIKASR